MAPTCLVITITELVDRVAGPPDQFLRNTHKVHNETTKECEYSLPVSIINSHDDTTLVAIM